MVRSGKKAPSDIYQIKTTLVGSHPPIWRRIEVQGNMTLDKLHKIIQTVMGWTNAHLHRFIIKNRSYAVPDRDDLGPNKPEDERSFTLKELATEEDLRFTYEYDFGDNWQHELTIEKIHQVEESTHYPRCLGGENACPPEDVGGISGYESFLEAMKDPKHPEHQAYRDWIGGDFDPSKFDLDRVNNLLQKTASKA